MASIALSRTWWKRMYTSRGMITETPLSTAMRTKLRKYGAPASCTARTWSCMPSTSASMTRTLSSDEPKAYPGAGDPGADGGGDEGGVPRGPEPSEFSFLTHWVAQHSK